MNGHGTQIDAIEANYGAAVSAPTAPTELGYKFVGWYEDEALNIEYTFSTMPVDGKTLYAKWDEARADYTVKHLQQKADGSGYEEVAADAQTLNGQVGTETKAEAKTYAGFKAQTVTQQTIAENGTVVEIKYDRIKYKITFDMNGHGDKIEPLEANYGAAVSAPTAPTATGYNFLGWYEDAACTIAYTFDTMPLNGKTAYAKWDGATVDYKVEHYKQKADRSGYELVETETKQGKVEGYTMASAKDYDEDGFTAKSFNQVLIGAEETAVVKIEYDRKTYSIKFDMNGQEGQMAPIEQYYGGTVTAPTTVPTASGYCFAGWFEDADGKTEYTFSTMPLNGKTVYAKWVEIEVKATSIDTSKVTGTSSASETVKEAAKQVASNTAAKAPATTLATAVDSAALDKKIDEWVKADTSETATSTEYTIKNVEIELKVDAVDIQEDDDSNITTIEYEVKPYANVTVSKYEEGSSAPATEKTYTEPIDNDALQATETDNIDVILPLVSDDAVSEDANYVNVVHEYSDGSGSEEFTCSISGSGSNRYIEFNVSKFSKFKLTFTNTYYEIGEISSVVYTGMKQEPEVKLTIDGETVNASSYSVDYKNNVNVGTATATVTIKKETISEEFKITQATPIIKASDVSVTYDGATHSPSVQAYIPNDKGNVMSLANKIKKLYYTDAACTLGESKTAPSAVGTYYAKLYVDETDNYAYAEKIVKVTIKAKSSSESTSHSSGGSGGGGGGGAYSSGVSALKFGAGSTAATVPNGGVAGSWKKDDQGKWTFTSNDKHEYKYEWAYVANPNADTSKGQEAASWFRFDTDGKMLTGWFKNVYGDWYYLNPVSDNTQGAMLKGWQFIDGYWYYLEEKEAASLGRLYVSKQTPDGKTVDADGHWIRNGAPVRDANVKPTA